MESLEKNRLRLHEKLCKLLGSRQCYYCPPTGLTMEYPCIRYERASSRPGYADNKIYKQNWRYTLIAIDYDPDSWIPTKLLETFPYCSQDRSYTANGLNHFVFTLYF